MMCKALVLTTPRWPCMRSAGGRAMPAVQSVASWRRGTLQPGRWCSGSPCAWPSRTMQRTASPTASCTRMRPGACAWPPSCCVRWARAAPRPGSLTCGCCPLGCRCLWRHSAGKTCSSWSGRRHRQLSMSTTGWSRRLTTGQQGHAPPPPPCWPAPLQPPPPWLLPPPAPVDPTHCQTHSTQHPPAPAPALPLLLLPPPLLLLPPPLLLVQLAQTRPGGWALVWPPAWHQAPAAPAQAPSPGPAPQR
ncbi:hypothetical protein V8C86DRAFT_2827339 [Haematococcus lacustris]